MVLRDEICRLQDVCLSSGYWLVLLSALSPVGT